MTTFALRVRRFAAIAAAVLMGAGCEDPGEGLAGATEPEGMEPANAVVGSTLEAISPRVQDAEVGQAATYNPVVRVFDPEGNPLANTWVRFWVTAGEGTISTSEGGAQVSSLRVRTGSTGYAGVVWTMGPQPGINSVRARVVNAGAVTFRANTQRDGVVEDVEVTPGSLVLEAIDAAQRLTAHALDSAGNVITDQFTWSSSNTRVVTVDATGMVRALANGTAAIIVLSSSGHADTATVQVAQRVSSVEVSPAAATIEVVGGTATLNAEATDANGHTVPGATVTWSSSNPTVASVSSGVVTGRAPGEATISALSDGHTGSASIVVGGAPPPPPPPGDRTFLFHSDWSTARGQTDAALRDLGKAIPWTQRIGNGRGNEVVASTGLAFPTANVLRVVAEDGDGDGDASSNVLRVESLPIPSTGETLYYRWYIRVTVPDQHTGDSETHPIQDGVAIGSTNWAFQIITRNDGTWLPSIETDAAAAWPNTHWGRPNIVLRKNVTYRFELAVRRTGSSTFGLNARIYGADGALLFDDNDFVNSNGTSSLADNPVLNIVNLNSMNGLNAGFNGLGGPSTLMPFTMYYQGGVAVCEGDWCGAYSSAESN